MACQNAAWLSQIVRTVRSLGAHLGRLMHPAAIVLAASLIAPTQASEAGHKEQIKLFETGDCADGCQEGPVWEEENWDKLQCEYAIDGWTEPGNFDRDFVQEWLDDSGISADSLCTCASLFMEDSAEDYAAEYAETEDPELYWSYLSLSIDQCQMAMWRRPLL